MKPILREITDKNGGTEIVFTPTAKMILYSIHKARNQGSSDSEVCDLAKIDRQLPMRWKVKFGTHFTEWLEQAIDTESGDDAMVLERFGMMQALQPGNYQYFRDMARNKGVLKDEVKEVKITLNTDFSALLGGDIEQARRRILLEARGVVVEGRPRVALADPKREHQGPGDRVGAVLEGPLEMAHALGPDRGRAERSQPVPALSEQATFTSHYSVLDEGEVPADPEE